MEFDRVEYRVDGNVANVIINRPEKLNAFDDLMCDEFASVWANVREDDEVHAVVLSAAGERAFSVGVDVREGLRYSDNVWSRQDPGLRLGPKSNGVWKPIVAAVNGMCAGGAFYWLNEADIIICGEGATFFDPHVTYGKVSALEPAGLVRRMPYGEVARWALMGLHERMSAARAHSIGLVSEVVADNRLLDTATDLAKKIAGNPPGAVQGTVRALWELADLPRDQAAQRGLVYPLLGNPTSQVPFGSAERPDFDVR